MANAFARLWIRELETGLAGLSFAQSRFSVNRTNSVRIQTSKSSMFKKTHNNILLTAIASIALTAVASLTADSNDPSASAFKEVVCFGDSLSDTGNLYQASGGTFPPSPYYEGRASNGILWNEYLAETLNLELTLENNYAYFGAETDYGNHEEGRLPLPLEGFAHQIDSYIDSLEGKRIHPRALVIVGIGANDFFSFLIKGEEMPLPSGIENTVSGIERLIQNGARNFLFLSVPDLGKVPALASMDAQTKAQVSYLVAGYNAQLQAAFTALEQEYWCKIATIDAYSIINEIIASPADFGLTNASIPAVQGADPQTSLFWDGVHPTTAGHRLLADYALAALQERYAHLEKYEF